MPSLTGIGKAHGDEARSDRSGRFEGKDLDAALDFMGTAILDFRASQTVFGDEGRLHRDVLADTTKQYLESLLAG